MSVIQSIRDKAAWIIIGAIALALIAFIVQDALQGGGRGLFSGNSTTLGKVNGTSIDVRDFEQRYKMAEENYRAQNYPVNDQLRSQIRESLWNEFVEDALMTDEYAKLGITISDKEVGDLLYGANPPQMLRQQFTDSTGTYNANMAYQAIRSLKKGSAQYNSFWGEFVPALEKSRQREKFTSLVGKSMYVPKWLLEKTNAENSQRSSISYVNVPYSTIPDSTIKISDEDVREYVDKHKDAYKQENERGLIYVSFDASPNSADSLSVYNSVANQKDALAAANTTSDIQNLMANTSSETPYFDGYVLSSKMQMSNADTLRRLADGQIIGPYQDGPNYTMAKMVSRRQMPDSVKCRHILIKIGDQQGQARTDSAAKKLIDSIETALKGGANFDSMVVKYSDDAGSKDKKGEYEFTSMQFSNLSKEFAEVIFYGNVGDKKIVKVENQSYSGYHYIEVLSQKKFETAFKIAYVSHAIIPSDETINGASGMASQFAGESRDLKSFDDNAAKRKLNKLQADVKESDFMIMGLGESREIIRWAFNDAKRGTVADHAYQVGDKFVVPAVVSVSEKGTMSVEKARPLVEYKVRNEKKAEGIIKKIGTAPTSLEAVAQASGQQILRADSVTFNSTFIPNVGNEMKVLGASFNKEYQTKVSAPIKGEIGVFVIKVDNITAAPNPNFDAKAQQQAIQQQMGAMFGYRAMEIMKKSATIKDNRIKFF
ncbi:MULTISPECIES: peptidylprolyl isomerase [Niastella]|uniref:Periplasmic chaperone PpiD n=1 Tax=Niastella soli TaxID=2821487 RepID=A0ABS3YPC5_9BACT|nr:peptidylprolyl isomerase [Niastella soli]MBO9199739.1 SurA N-terminal domain-containing protein [Niastella soli]